jgi:hypothetical protein
MSSKANYIPTKSDALKKLGNFPTPSTKVRVEDQDVSDIMTWMAKWHKECTHNYDVLFPMFDADGSWYDVGQRIFDFCKESMRYEIESVQWQYASSPMTLLRNGYCDCKGYALFIGGVIDAMKRAGEPVSWCFRFASYNILNSLPGHVFVVLFPGKNEIWIDPVLDTYDSKVPRPSYTTDKYVDTCRSKNAVALAGIGFIPGGGPVKMTKLSSNAVAGISSGEKALLSSVDEYVEGVNNGIQVAQASGTLNAICGIVLATASLEIPLIAAIWAAVKLLSAGVTSVFGAGSEASILIGDVASNPLLAPGLILNSILDGRTYQSDQYRAAQFYQWYVLSNTKDNALNKTPDSDVIPALKWFCDRLGVFVSGAEHIIALTQSPGAYMALYAVNNYTTTDENRVNAAYNVASQYFVFNNVAGSWAQTLGVYDALIAAIAQQQDETSESAAAQVAYQGVYSTAATSGPAPVTETPGATTEANPLIAAALIAAAALIILI